MSLKTKSLIVLLVISLFVLSSCEVYQTLYGKPAQGSSEDTGTQETTEPADGSMEDVSGEVTEVPEETVEETPVEEVPEETPEEVTEEPAPADENPFVVTVEETEMVNLAPKADDPDSDNIAFTFTSPLDDNGEWRTTYGDNGEYTVTVTASDGELTTTRDVLVIVQKKEESPSIDSSKPVEGAFVIDETDNVQFSVEASDLNRDALEYTWKLDGVPVSSDYNYEYQSTYDDAGPHTVKADITDGTSSASRIWSMDVVNVNRLPVMSMLEDVHARETDVITIAVDAEDEDRDNIDYSISDSRFEQDGNVFTWETDYSSAGAYEVTVKASDGQDTTEQTINVVVDNVNRPPVITDIGQKD